MNKQRQDAWTKDEDMQLTEAVLRHIRNGGTQIEAFKQVAETLSRTPAACGFRWNATIRKQHSKAIDLARNSRKQEKSKKAITLNESEHEMIGSAIGVLEKIKATSTYPSLATDEATLKTMLHLQLENRKLKAEVKRYREAWHEMNQLWNWIQNSNEP